MWDRLHLLLSRYGKAKPMKQKTTMSRKYSDIVDELTGRIETFYYLLNERKFVEAFSMLDKEVFEQESVMNFQRRMELFRNTFKKINIEHVTMNVHLMKKCNLYNNRDYAIGRAYWRDGGHPEWCVPRWFGETWVRGPSTWYNRTSIPLVGDDHV